MGYPVTGVKLNSDLKMDLDALLGASKGAARSLCPCMRRMAFVGSCRSGRVR